MPDRIADVIDPNYMIPVYVERGWASASNCAVDVFIATGLPIAGEGVSMNLDTYVHFWEGPDDSDDLACLKVAAAGTASYVDMDADACDWSSDPPKGSIAYIIGITFVK